MDIEKERKRMSRGCMMVSLLLIVTGVLAFTVDGRFGFLVLFLIFSWISICSVLSKKEDRFLKSAADSIFSTFEGCQPVVKKGSSYGYPFFSVCFMTKEEMELAFSTGHLGEFRSFVEKNYGFDGFDIEKGFDETYIGWEGDFMELGGDEWIRKKEEKRKRYYSRNPITAESGQ